MTIKSRRVLTANASAQVNDPFVLETFLLLILVPIVCLVEDPATKRHQPRNYLETLEERVAFLEGIIARQNSGGVALDSQPGGVLQPPEFEPGPFAAGQLPEQQDGNPSSFARINGDGDEVGDLASKVGMLSFAAGAEPHYLGSSSTFAFSRVINSTLLQAIPRRKDGIIGSHRDTRPLPSPCLLPDYEHCVKLSDAYFR